MSAAFLNDRRKAMFYALAAVATASSQDAIVKFLSSSFPASQTVFFRAIVAALILLPWLYAQRQDHSIWPANVRLVLLRGAILCTGYFCFVLSIAALPIATSVSIYFTMPFFVAALAGRALGEKVKSHRWIAISAGFAGVLLMVRPGAESFEPAALLALASAFGYAIGQLLSRHVSQSASPVVVTFWQSTVYGVVAIALTALAPFFEMSAESGKVAEFLLRPWVMPD
ncbi:MAG: DMT family transporter, partial [Phyllobacteriaceae bacterium]|nr:DMT family transporter [Phyllobacteriaceae bacterium]